MKQAWTFYLSLVQSSVSSQTRQRHRKISLHSVRLGSYAAQIVGQTCLQLSKFGYLYYFIRIQNRNSWLGTIPAVENFLLSSYGNTVTSSLHSILTKSNASGTPFILTKSPHPELASQVTVESTKIKDQLHSKSLWIPLPPRMVRRFVSVKGALEPLHINKIEDS